MNTFLWRVFPVALFAVRGLLKSQHALAVPVEVEVYLWLKTHSLLPDVSALTARWFRFGYAGHTGQDSFTSGVFLFISALVVPLVAWGFCPF